MVLLLTVFRRDGSSANKFCAIIHPNTESGSPRMKFRLANMANQRTLPTWCVIWFHRWRVISLARSSRLMAACAGISFNHYRSNIRPFDFTYYSKLKKIKFVSAVKVSYSIMAKTLAGEPSNPSNLSGTADNRKSSASIAPTFVTI